ncbi:hypothetical protein [Halobacteriovorax sp. JY17]|uniref:hypothetical protein n=1 Tax=Halobacteriovorax sp. JY17 TaxID=2014617 RepID=UPI000C608F8C|nr:hypothetical protein [Halobacteriovorax sp. JY17]PIK15564.1 MAG: hypothetical protein CES88_02245 [Halobacteriovorax sp. JY17]
MSKTSNPLYHISKDGKDVESVNNIFELLVKKFGLEPIISFLESMFEFMSEQVQSYAVFIALKELIDEIVEKLYKVIEKVQPLLEKL